MRAEATCHERGAGPKRAGENWGSNDHMNRIPHSGSKAQDKGDSRSHGL